MDAYINYFIEIDTERGFCHPSEIIVPAKSLFRVYIRFMHEGARIADIMSSSDIVTHPSGYKSTPSKTYDNNVMVNRINMNTTGVGDYHVQFKVDGTNIKHRSIPLTIKAINGFADSYSDYKNTLGAFILGTSKLGG